MLVQYSSLSKPSTICIGGFFMKKFLLSTILFCSLLTGCSYDIQEKTNLESKLISMSIDSSASEIASMVEPAIVGISGVSGNSESIGSGVCVSKEGHILTNSHVINGCSSITLYLSNGDKASGSVIFEDTVNDLAIIKSSKTLPYLALGSSDQMSVGDDVLAVGTPLSLSLTHTFTKGIVSALNRTLKVSSTSGEGYMQNLIQHDASLNPGNSGGPLLNSKGEVVGINTLKVSGGEGLGFAIPSKSFESLLDSFVDNINYELPYLGVYGLDSAIASYYDNDIKSQGFYIIDVSCDSPLGECGLKEGCVITKFNGKDIFNTLDLKDELYKLSSKDTVVVEYRNGEELYRVKTKLSR